MTLRYVVLHHTGWGDEHFDLLLETSADGPLASWRLSAWPPVAGMGVVQNIEHRRLYLDYEGPISGDRGSVRRVDAGTYERRSAAPGVFRVWLIDAAIELLLPANSII